MVQQIIYPTPEKIIEHNVLMLNLIKAKKADKPGVLSYARIVNVINRCKKLDSDIYDKAVSLMKGLIREHAFESGNRRTAFIATKEFVTANSGRFKIMANPAYARAMQGIREGYYADKEVKEWIKNGKIREFKR